MWFSVGNIFKWGDSPNLASRLEYVRGLPIDGVELTFARPAEVFAFAPTPEEVAWLIKVGVGIHAPMVSRFGGDTEGIAAKLREWSHRLDARYVVFHPPDLLSDAKGMPVAVENMSPRWKIDIDSFDRIVGDHLIVIDVSHAVQWGKDEIRKYVERYHKRITAVHFNYLHKGKDFRELAWFGDAIRPLKWVHVPFVIERPLEPGADLQAEIAQCEGLLKEVFQGD
ncbi:MAG: hypothetical protein ACQESG_04955 [Nanobdellota archaeon]